MSDPLSDFIDAMSAAGIVPESASDIIANDKWTAFRLYGDRPNKKVGYARLKIDGDFAVGNFGSYREGITHTWTSKQKGRKHTAEEKKEYKERIEAARKDAEQQRQDAEVKAAHKAKIIWDGAEYARPDHPYLQRKKIGPHNFKQHEGKLLIPMWADKKLQGYQSIDEEGDKLFLKGGRLNGCYCPIMEKGESLDVILLCEGVATGATIREIMGLPTIVCFTAGNLEPVVKDFRERYPQSKLVICADNDSWQRLHPTDPERVYVGADSPLNTGVVKATQAATKAGYARVVYPVFPEDCKDTDFNDLALREGEDAVRARIDEALTAPMPEIPKAPLIPVKRIRSADTDWEGEIIRKDNGAPTENSRNYMLVVCNHPRLRGIFAYDEFHLCTMVIHEPPWHDPSDKFDARPLSETDIRNTDYWLQKTYDLKGAKEKTLDSIEECALRNKFHPARDKLASLVWDGTPRLDNWLITYAKAKDDPAYLRAIGSKWLIAGVKRLMEPGCKFDNMLILEGPQNAGKDMTFEILSRFGPPDDYMTYFNKTINISRIDEPDELMCMNGTVIVDLQEMSGFSKRDDDAIKKFITTTHDTYRAPYARRPEKIPRQFILGGTLNPKDGIFKDSTGLRRFWIVEVGKKIDLDGLERDREQLWAEAVYRYKQGETLLLSEEIAVKAAAAADERKVIDDSTQDVLAAVAGRKFFETRDVLKAMGITLAPGKSQAESRTVNDILRFQGYRRCKRTKAGKTTWGWEPPFGQYTLEEQEEEIEL